MLGVNLEHFIILLENESVGRLTFHLLLLNLTGDLFILIKNLWLRTFLVDDEFGSGTKSKF